MEYLEQKIAQSLLQIKAIKLQPTNPFTWASGWKSPIYCDNRKTLSYPEVRDFIKESFVQVVTEKYGKPDFIAGVATGAIAENKRVIVIEDLVSTGKSSLNAIEALRNQNIEVLGMVAIFTYGFKIAEDNFKNANIQLQTLSNYNQLIQFAVKTGYI